MIEAVRSWVARITRRPSEHEWAFLVALAVSTRGECSRRRVGAVIVDAQNRIVGAGYNGTYRGGPSCLTEACPRAASGVDSGSSYDTGPGACIAVHAELNALLDVSDRKRLESSEMYITAEPCEGCLKILRNTQIYRIYWLDDQGGVNTTIWPFTRD